MDTQHRSDTGRTPAAGQPCEACGGPAEVIDEYGDAECRGCAATFEAANAGLQRLADRVLAAIADARAAGLPDEWIDWALDDARTA